MPDIDAYVQCKKYMSFQHKRPDYKEAIALSLDFAKKNVKNKNIVVGDFCCGTGDNTKKFADKLDGLQKAILVDINKGFLEIVKNSHIKTKEFIIHHDDILNVKFEKECDVIFSIFAYHHIPDKNKIDYVNQIKKCLKKGGILILAEIFFDNKKQCLEYYKDLYENIPIKSRIQGLKKFLKQTAESNDFEFKVSKKFSDTQFKENGFKLIDEIKVWPKNNTSNLGTFVQVYTN